jgi:hypothetical protein
MLIVLAGSTLPLIGGFRIASLSLIPCFFQLLLASPLFTVNFFFSYGEIKKKKGGRTVYGVIAQLHWSCFDLLLIIERRSMHGRMLFRQCGTKATQLIQVATCSFAVKLNLVRESNLLCPSF